MILVDTSIWIDFFNKPSSKISKKLTNLIINNEFLCINSLIQMEILQGIKSEEYYYKTKDFLRPYLYYNDISFQYLDKATEIYRTCRKSSKTIRKSIDCIIAANAIIENLTIFHKDHDFEIIRKVFRNLSTIQ